MTASRPSPLLYHHSPKELLIIKQKLITSPLFFSPVFFWVFLSFLTHCTSTVWRTFSAAACVPPIYFLGALRTMGPGVCCQRPGHSSAVPSVWGGGTATLSSSLALAWWLQKWSQMRQPQAPCGGQGDEGSFQNEGEGDSRDPPAFWEAAVASLVLARAA